MRTQWFQTAMIAVVATGWGVLSANAQTITLPPAHGKFDYQLGGDYNPQGNVEIVVRDRTVAPVKDKYNICYVNAFQTQPKLKKWWTTNHPDLLVKKNGEYVTDPKWTNEYILDVSTVVKQKKLMDIIGPWIDQCAADGFKAIEPDNLDSWDRSKGVLSPETNTKFAKLLVKRAHDAYLAIAQKNASELAPKGPKEIRFDFAIVEECEYEKECNEYTKVYGNQVYEIEYNDYNKDHNGKPVDPVSFFNAACDARGDKISIIYRDRKVVRNTSPDYEYEVCD
ncbi:endo alpha-1,4 polygalactosaminidase [Phyllobacterium meliloti]|uniref:endo alpha-1,4 polygalactosaminidase n=1 Tax=Phyllobacterium meliloti TaxID=555317 RepID=UPI001D155A72|nr:endo alpha-1,4 polygalactosaminidase [Phyllobacterium sp. T1293]UGX89392.1 endo alpha-1,4 polygalactosaminidase [Phyllobacterium sp. T1293]